MKIKDIFKKDTKVNPYEDIQGKNVAGKIPLIKKLVSSQIKTEKSKSEQLNIKLQKNIIRTMDVIFKSKTQDFNRYKSMAQLYTKGMLSQERYLDEIKLEMASRANKGLGTEEEKNIAFKMKKQEAAKENIQRLRERQNTNAGKFDKAKDTGKDLFRSVLGTTMAGQLFLLGKDLISPEKSASEKRQAKIQKEQEKFNRNEEKLNQKILKATEKNKDNLELIGDVSEADFDLNKSKEEKNPQLERLINVIETKLLEAPKVEKAPVEPLKLEAPKIEKAPVEPLKLEAPKIEKEEKTKTDDLLGQLINKVDRINNVLNNNYKKYKPLTYKDEIKLDKIKVKRDKKTWVKDNLFKLKETAIFKNIVQKVSVLKDIFKVEKKTEEDMHKLEGSKEQPKAKIQKEKKAGKEKKVPDWIMPLIMLLAPAVIKGVIALYEKIKPVLDIIGNGIKWVWDALKGLWTNIAYFFKDPASAIGMGKYNAETQAGKESVLNIDAINNKQLEIVKKKKELENPKLNVEKSKQLNEELKGLEKEKTNIELRNKQLKEEGQLTDKDTKAISIAQKDADERLKKQIEGTKTVQVQSQPAPVVKEKENFLSKLFKPAPVVQPAPVAKPTQVKVPDKVVQPTPVQSAKLPVTKKVVKKATGGRVTQGAKYLVGERGPEKFIPDSSGSVIPSSSNVVREDIEKSKKEEKIKQDQLKVLNQISENSKTTTVTNLGDNKKQFNGRYADYSPMGETIKYVLITGGLA
jgi:hypothetical protein